MWEEGVRVALRCLTETPFTGHAGDHVRMPPRNVVPKPLQRPHPPTWVACSRRETIHLAAQHGLGALSFSFFDPEEARRWVDDYYTTLAAEGVPIGDAVNANLACVTSFFCHEDDGGGGATGRRRVQLHRLLPRALLRLRPPRPGHRRPVGRVHRTPERARLRSRSRRRSRPRTPSVLGAKAVEAGTTGLRGAIGTPGPGPRLPAPLRGVRCRPDHPVVLGRQQPPRAHHGEHSSSSPRSDAGVRRTRRAVPDREGTATRAGHRDGDGPEARRRPSTDRSRLRRSPPTRASTPTTRKAGSSHRWLDDYADRVAGGEDVGKRLR